MYFYPKPNNSDYFNPICINNKLHSMGDSLYPYLQMKIHSSLCFNNINTIKIVGEFDRDSIISDNEKGNKIFNYMRPSLLIEGEQAFLKCFPGIDYVFHFSSIIKSYSDIIQSNVKVECTLPDEYVCWNEVCKSSIKDIPVVDTVIMGYVEGLEYLSEDKKWSGTGNFLYKRIKTKSGEALLIGCKHTYWGDIAGRIVLYLASLGVKRVIYSGELGTLNDFYVPNETIATGNCSCLPNNRIIYWDNLFENAESPIVKKGKHITIPSVLQENKKWVSSEKKKYSFVDPEIGHMAYAAQKANIKFSYLHIISDNLSKKYMFDLSNERKQKVLLSRKRLMQLIGKMILDV